LVIDANDVKVASLDKMIPKRQIVLARRSTDAKRKRIDAFLEYVLEVYAAM